MTDEEWLISPPRLEIDGSVPCHFGQSFRVPNAPGIYMFHDLRGALYVGRSTDLHRRFNEHLWRTSNAKLSLALSKPLGELHFSWFLVEYPDQVELERALIHYFQPVCNTQGKL